MLSDIRFRVCAVLLVAGFVHAQEQKPSLRDFAWLAGCWERRSSDREVLEQWMTPAGDLMLGMSRTMVSGKAREFEFL